VFGGENIVIVPSKHIQELSHAPDNVLDFQTLGAESLGTEYTGDTDLEHNMFHFDIVRKQLTRKLPLLTNDVYAELELSLQEHWGAKQDEWTTVPGFDSCMKVISRAANRVFCGKELCRNEEFLEALRVYTTTLFANGFLINMLPRWLRPVLAPLIVHGNENNLNICKKFAVPIIEKRLAKILSQKLGSSGVLTETDALEWLLEDAIKLNDPAELNPVKLCRRIIRLNMVAIHTTTITMLGTLIDIYSAPDHEDIVAGLREEATRVLEVHGGDWSKAAVNELHRIDSAIKESMRYSGLGLVGMMRRVVGKDGVTLGDDIHIPHGMKLMVPQMHIHGDHHFYDRPDAYDAFRFSRARETRSGSARADSAIDGSDNGQKDVREIIEQKSQGIITTTDRFLGFGHGKHACPGRFFASQEMKLMLAHIVMTYDVRLNGVPSKQDISLQTLPDTKMMFDVRLR